MIEIYNNNPNEIPKEDYARNYYREQYILQEEKKYDLKRLEQVENDIMELNFYDF